MAGVEDFTSISATNAYYGFTEYSAQEKLADE